MKSVKKFDQFINEAKIQVKQKYTEKYPAKMVSTYAPVREKILSFVKENSPVSKADLIEFLKRVNEESGKSTSLGWITRNKQYFVVEEKGDKKTYKLSSLGERVFAKTQTLNKD